MKYIISLSIIIIFTSCAPIKPSIWVQQSETNTNLQVEIDIKGIEPISPLIITDSVLVITSKDRLSFINTKTNKTIKTIEVKTDVSGLLNRSSGWWGYYSPTIFNDKTIYHFDNNETLRAFDINTGNLKWCKNGIIRPAKNPIFENDKIYFSSESGTFAIDKRNGEIKWKVASEESRIEGVMMEGNCSKCVIVKEIGRRLLAISKSNGDIIWSKDLHIESALFLEEESRVIFSSIKKNKIYYIDAMSGDDIVSFESNGVGFNKFFIYDNQIYNSSNKRLTRVDLINKKEVEVLKNTRDIFSEPQIFNNLIISKSLNIFKKPELYAINVNNSKLEWSIIVNNLTLQPICKNNSIFIIKNNEIIQADVNTGVIKKRYNNDDVRSAREIRNTSSLYFISIKDGKLNILKK